MRKIAVAALALPVLAAIYAPVLARMVRGRRVWVGFATLALAAIAAIGLAAPRMTSARPPATVTALSASTAGTIEAHAALTEPVRLTFSTRMDPQAVSDALIVDPATDVDLSWDATGTQLTVSPRGAWKPATYYTIVISTSARDAGGGNLARPVRAIFTTRPAYGSEISVSDQVASGMARTTTSFVVTFEGPVNVAEAEAAFTLTPAVDGSFVEGTTAAGATILTYVPLEALAPDTDYTAAVTGTVHDADGAPTANPAELRIHTPVAPAVVRFRPLAGATGVASTAAVSVRFTVPMDRASTAVAFAVRVGSSPVKGQVSWAENDTVLVFDPARAFAAGAKVVAEVSGGATDTAGTPLGATTSATFRVAGPVASTATTPASTTTTSATTSTTKATSTAKAASKTTTVKISTGGSAVGAGSWHAVETYYLKLMNCTRGGGWVTASGDCSSPGGSGIAPLILSAGISDAVSRPYAKFLASQDICDHFADGTPGDRLHAAGYAGDYRENIGCRADSPFASVLGTHLYFQSEKPCSGYCHYNNIMSTKMKYVGIGVWVYSGRVRLVVDFWEG